MAHEAKQFYTVKRNGRAVCRYYTQTRWTAEMEAWKEFGGLRKEYKATSTWGRN